MTDPVGKPHPPPGDRSAIERCPICDVMFDQCPHYAPLNPPQATSHRTELSPDDDNLVGKPHPQQTQEKWLAHCGQAAMQTAFNAIPAGDTERAGWFCNLLMRAVRGDMTLAYAQEQLVEKWT
jgi:hypothetical protein